eukprot:CAMPEP_0119299386 /NCGR_PEP_ID=MMETSP1333-20130426/1460_1 /TAXON_ID=418940 /ORGANISM="Scyphosphaera apsteinii, Strain RCC1455" /LENGTH=254 /DNA_ID=CAMNT_0007300795 /DNA_START=137 /DNA_END=901 /DNA_ORIENTATION=+
MLAQEGHSIFARKVYITSQEYLAFTRMSAKDRFEWQHAHATDLRCNSTTPHTENCDPNLAWALELAASKPGVLLDVGAHGGRQTRTGLRFNRHVYGVECSAQTFTELNAMFANESRAQMIHMCAGSSMQLTTVHVVGSDSETRGSNFITQNSTLALKKDKNSEIAVVVPLDGLFADIQVAVIKLDIQGAEYDAFRGLKIVLERNRPALMFEHEKRFGQIYGHKSVVPMLRALGYKNCVERALPIGNDVICPPVA